MIGRSVAEKLCQVAAILLLAGAPVTAGTETAAYRLAPDTLTTARQCHEGLQGDWRYRSGDDTRWANPAFDDSSWKVVARPFEQLPTQGWRSVGWFRLWIDVAPSLIGQPIALWSVRIGAIEIYIDGKLRFAGNDIEAVKRGGPTPSVFRPDQPTTIVFQRRGRHLIAVRFASNAVAAIGGLGLPNGFNLSLADPKRSVTYWSALQRHALRLNFFFVGASLAIALLHVLLFFYYRERRENLYYAISTFSVATIAYSSTWFSRATTTTGLQITATIFFCAIVVACVAGLRFYYSVFLQRVPRLYWAFFFTGAATVVFSWLLPRGWVYGFALIAFAEQSRTLVVAIARRREGAWIVGVGGLASIATTVPTILADHGLIGNVPFFLYLYGFLALLVSISVFLARAIARDKRNLDAQLDRVKELSELSLAQERRAKQEALSRRELEAANAQQQLRLAEAKKREKVLAELESANKRLRETQSQLVQSEKIAALGQLVAGVTHEVNTPLGAMRSTHDSIASALGMLRQLLGAECPQLVQSNRRLQRILSSLDQASGVVAAGSERLSDIVKRLRSFARLDEAELKRVDIRAGLDDTIGLLGHELKGVEVVKDYGEVPPINCYPRQLNQAFLNLLVNARQAIDNGKGKIRVATSAASGQVNVTIQDNGSGIDRSELNKIFDPGYTTRGVGVGAGLGLATCYRIVNAHKGRITVESEVGKGSTFTIELPTQAVQ